MAGEERLDFLDSPHIEHPDKTAVAPRVQLFARGEQDQRVQGYSLPDPAFALALPCGHWPPGGANDLQRTAHTRGVVGIECCRAFGVFAP